MVFMQSGSTMDTFATMALHLSDFLSPFSGLVRTANPFPSEPVPQVVGISTSGSTVSLTQAKIQPQPDIRRKGNGEHRKLGIHIRGYIHIHILERRGTCGLILNTGRYIFEEDITDEIVRLCHRYSFPLFTMPWDTRIFDITHDYYNRIFEDSRDDGNMTAAFQNILMGNSLTDEQTDTIKGSGFNNGCYNVLSIDTEATDEFMYILQKVCNNTDLVFHAFVYDGNPTVILRCPSSGSIADKCSDIAEALVARFPDRSIHMGSGSTVLSLTELSLSYRRAISAREFAADNIYCDYNSLGFLRILLEVNDAQLINSFIAEQLGGVIEYDKTHHSALTDTLYEYLKCSGSVQHISEKMFCHRNTINYRLRIIKEELEYKLREIRKVYLSPIISIT